MVGVDFICHQDHTFFFVFFLTFCTRYHNIAPFGTIEKEKKIEHFRRKRKKNYRHDKTNFGCHLPSTLLEYQTSKLPASCSEPSAPVKQMLQDDAIRSCDSFFSFFFFILPVRQSKVIRSIIYETSESTRKAGAFLSSNRYCITARQAGG